MKYINLGDLSFFQIEVFLAAARELNYTRAAQLCNTTQPTVSRQIAALENTLGIILFVKGAGRPQLTPAGQWLKTELDKEMRNINQSIHRAWEIQKGQLDHLRITLPSHMDHLKLFFPMKSLFPPPEKRQSLHINYFVEDGDRALNSLLQSDTDVVIAASPFWELASSNNQLDTLTLLRHPISALMLRTNPLSSRSSVSVEDLKKQRLILPMDERGTTYRSAVLDYFANAQSVPRVAAYGSSFEECLVQLNEPDEFMFVDKTTVHYNSNFLALVDVADMESGYFAVWRKSDGSSVVIREFLEFLKLYFSHLQPDYF